MEASSPIEEDVLSTVGSMVPLAGEFVIPADVASSGARPAPDDATSAGITNSPASGTIEPTV
ncbi:hypothetical protein CN095_36790, partial [Sinorhizobium meliloti]